MKFKFYGNGNWYRTEKKLAEIDKKEADSAYRKCKKEILDPFMKSKGFIKWGTTSYVRMNEAGIIENVFLQKERYGSKTFTVNLEFAPLYIPYEHDIISFHSHRLSMEINGKDFWWDFKDCETAEKSFENIVQALEMFGMQYFEDKRTPKQYIKWAMWYNFKNQYFPKEIEIRWKAFYYLKFYGISKAKKYCRMCQAMAMIQPYVKKYILTEVGGILNKLDNVSDVELFLREITEENIEKGKLPKGLLK